MIDIRQGDCLELQFIQADAARFPFADGTFDLVFTSPPYMDARTYGIGAQRDCEAWVEWMLTVVQELTRVCKGLVLINCAGVTRDKTYWPGCEGLMWEWWRRGLGPLWRPAYWHRVGIPGSGGKQWLRADIEYVIPFKRDAEWLEWADNTANGHRPKWAPGGEMSHRLTGSDGRVNRDQWGGTGHATGGEGRHANGERKKRITRRATSGKRQGDTINGESYTPPVLANPGNLIRLGLTFEDITGIILHYANATKARPIEVLRNLQSAASPEAISRWLMGIGAGLYAQTILRESGVHGEGLGGDQGSRVPDVWEDVSSEGGQPAILFPEMQRELAMDGARADSTGHIALSRSQDDQDREVCEMRSNRKSREAESLACPSSGRKSDEQRARESAGSLPSVSSQRTLEVASSLSALWTQSEEVQGLWSALRHALPQIQKVWRSSHFQARWWALFGSDEASGLITGIKVGGGRMGHKLAHENEAPFPEKLADWFIRSWCPPGGRVLDPFSGSGTTVASATKLGRVGIGCDLRFSQCQLGRRRCGEIQLDLFG